MTLIASHSNSLLAGLRSFWKLNGNFDDVNGLNTYVTYPPFTFSTGLHGAQAFNQSSANGYTNPPNNNHTLPLGKSVRTMNVWFKDLTPAVNGVRSIAGYGADNPSQLFIVGIGNDSKLFFWGNTFNVSGNTLIDLSKWNMATVTYDGYILRLYLNGVLDTATTLNLNTEELIINFGYGAAYNQGDGLIQDFGIWGRILTPKEINTLYNNGLGLDITAIPTDENLLTSTSKGKALKLDGINQYVALPDDPKLDIRGDLTIKARIMISSLKANNAICSRGGGSPTDIQWLLSVENGHLVFYSSDGNGLAPLYLNSAIPLKIGVWYDVIAGCKGAERFLTIDYIQYSLSGYVFPRTVYVGPVAIGCYSKYPGQFTHHGLIDRVKIWNRALTVVEALADNTVSDTNGLVADYQFEADAKCSNDYTLNGTIMNGANEFVGSASSYADNKNNTIDLNGIDNYFRIPLVGIRSMTFMYNGDFSRRGYLLDMRSAVSGWLYWGSYSANVIPVIKVNNVVVGGNITAVWAALNTNSWNHVYLEFNSPITTNMFMGSRYVANEFMCASFKDISTFNNVLTTQEVTDLYNGNTTTTTPKLVKHYDLSTKDDLTLVNVTLNARKLLNVGKNPASYRKGCLDTTAMTTDVGCYTPQYLPQLNITDAITVECWVKPIISGREMFPMAKWENGASPESTSWLLGFHSNNQVIAIVRKEDLSFQTLQQSTTTLASGVWNHIAFTYDGATMKLYINATMTDSFATTGKINISSLAPVRLGGIGFPGYNFLGEFDNCRVWNRALTALDILINKNMSLDTAPNLVSNWRLDDPGKPLLRDSSGNNNHVLARELAVLKISDNVNLI